MKTGMRSRTQKIVKKLVSASMATLLMVGAAMPVWGAAATQQAPTGTLQQTVESDSHPAFADLEGHYAQEAVERLASLHLIKGTSNDQFAPQTLITRRDFSVLFARVAGLQPMDSTESHYEDLSTPEGQAALPYVNALRAADLLQGRSDDHFGAADPLTRQELAVVLSRFMEATNSLPTTKEQTNTSDYQDRDQIAAYALEAVKAVTQKQWMSGSNQLFRPLGKVTRAEAAVIVDRVLSERVSQAENTVFAVNADKLKLTTGEEQKLKVSSPSGGPLPFTPIFSFDRPDIGLIQPDGTFVAGPAAGKGQVTVSVGYKTMTIPVEITPIEAATDTETGSEQSAEQKQVDQEKQASPEETKISVPEEGESLSNLAPGSLVNVTTTGPADSYFHKLEMAYPGPKGGIVTPSDTWTGFARQFGREVTVALPHTSVLDHVSMSFRQNKKAGILFPTKMEVEVSQDGESWHYAGRATHAASPADETDQVRTLTISLPQVEANYVRVRFPVQIFVFARDLQIWGTPELETGDGPAWFAPTPTTAALVDKKAEDRMKDLLLAYSGAHEQRGTWTKEDFLPLVGYIDTDGKVKDRMFDSVLFLPYPIMPTSKDGWEYYLNDVFRPGRQLDALNEAMKEYNKQRGKLYIDPEIEKVVLTLPYPTYGTETFGQININQDPITFSGQKVGIEKAHDYRKQALAWYLQELLQKWEKADYKYLKLEGIYWYHEIIDDAVPGERQLIRETADMVHDQSLRFYWIPYYGATGLGEWKDLGFDYAFVQPNFYSNNDVPVDRIEAALEVANRYGMGVEVEGDERMVRDVKFYQLYYNQLIAGHKAGIDKDKIHAYYFGSKSLLEAVNNKEPKARAVYDDTYRWMRGLFTETEYLDPNTKITP